MIIVYLMDLKGDPQRFNEHSDIICNPMEGTAWLTAFTTVCSLPEGKELRVRFQDVNGETITAYIISNSGNVIEIHPGGDISLYMYVSGIFLD